MTATAPLTVAVAGGTGTVGRLVVEELTVRGHAVRVLSRTPRPGADHRHVDLRTGEGLADALAGADAVIDAANAQGRGMREVLVEGTRRLLDAEARAGVAHHVLISIVGIEAVPVGYYRAKLEQEAVLARSPVPTSVLRATQFHALVDQLFSAASRIGVLPAGQATLQPVDAADVARALAGAVEQGPWPERHELAGPEVLTLGQLARTWMRITGRRRALVALPPVGRAMRGLRAGGLTAPEAPRGELGFAEWLARRAALSG